MAEPVRIHRSKALPRRIASGRGATLLSLPFVVLGGVFAAIGQRGVELKGANAPGWAALAFGLAFLATGLVLFGNAVLGSRAAARRRALAAAPPWERDFPWDASGTSDRAGARVANAFFGAVLLAVLLAPFNWWAFLSGKGPLPVEVLVGLLDLLPLLAFGNACYLLAQLARYGSGRLGFHGFPFFLGGRLSVAFSPSRFAEVRFVLRCVEERHEATGPGRSRGLACYELHRDERTLEPGPRASEEVAIAFDLPHEPEWATRLDATPFRYWELLVEAEEPGIDFATSFILPVYAPPAQSPPASRPARVERVASYR